MEATPASFCYTSRQKHFELAHERLSWVDPYVNGLGNSA